VAVRLTYVALGVVVGFVIGTATLVSHAEDLDRAVSQDTIAAATEAGVRLVDLLGAISTTGVPGRAYLISVGELAPPVAVTPASFPVDRLVECLAWHESRGFAGAYNRSSGASGLLQFLPGTWMTTPQGKAGLSVFDPSAARAAAKWMIGQGRLHEWSTWRMCA
jgi:hypothetical protein